MPTNYAILQLVAGPEVMRDPTHDRIPDGMKPADFEPYHAAQRLIEELALYLKPLSKRKCQLCWSSFTCMSVFVNPDMMLCYYMNEDECMVDSDTCT